MLTKLTIRNLKCLDDAEIELGNSVVFVGPNNSGKTTALQALALWHVGLDKWMERRGADAKASRRPGVAINRKDLTVGPVPRANLLWRDLHVRDVLRADGKQRTENVRIEVLVEGIWKNDAWTCGLEFDYANEESFYCRPLRSSPDAASERMDVPDAAKHVRVAYLPPMSGLAAEEVRLEAGTVRVRIGEGRTAEVIRNLCHQVYESDPSAWKDIAGRIEWLFGAEFPPPRYDQDRGELTMSYRERDNVLDISSAGRGLHQMLLLLAYMHANNNAVLLLDEPDAHLEILRQQQVYDVLTEVARACKSQLLIATHSEVLLREAAERDVVVAFLGRPHRIADRGQQLRKALAEIPWEDYYLARQTGWILYLEGSTDLSILREFAKTLGHPAGSLLERPFVHYVGNQPADARKHFYGLREAYPDLRAILIVDHISTQLQPTAELAEHMWKRREMENYLCSPIALRAYAEDEAREAMGEDSLFAQGEAERRRNTMEECIRLIVPPIALDRPEDPYWVEEQGSRLLERVFEEYYKRLGIENLMRKTNYHHLARFVPRDLIDSEIADQLDHIFAVASKVNERRNPDP
jgi:predicted ATPase